MFCSTQPPCTALGDATHNGSLKLTHQVVYFTCLRVRTTLAVSRADSILVSCPAMKYLKSQFPLYSALEPGHHSLWHVYGDAMASQLPLLDYARVLDIRMTMILSFL